jgi:hypothetical protein
MKNCIPLIFVLLIGVSCVHDPVLDHVAQEDQKCSFSSSYFYYVDGSGYSVRYGYSAEGRLLQEEVIDAGGVLLFKTVYEYESGKLEKQILGAGERIAEIHYTYNDKELQKTEYREFKNEPVEQHFERHFEYTDGRISKIVEYDLTNGKSFYTLLFYEAGNIARFEAYDLNTNQQKWVTQLGYDDKINPCYGMMVPTGNAKYSSKNNITSMVTLESQGERKELIYQYDYDDMGRPLKQYLLLNGQRKLPEQSFVYTCE